MTGMFSAMVPPLASIQFASAWPWWIWGALVLACTGVLVHTYHKIYRRTGKPMAWWLLALRLVGVLGLLMVMAGPVWSTTKTRIHKPSLILIMDDSASMSLHVDTTRLDESSTNKHVTRYTLAHRLLNDPLLQSLLADRFDLHAQTLQGRDFNTDSQVDKQQILQTDLLGALHLAAGRARNTGAQAVLLVSDGHDTTERNNWLSLTDYPLPIHTAGFPEQPEAEDQIELAITQLHAPDEVLVHHQVSIALNIRRQGGKDALSLPLTLMHGQKVLATTTLKLPAGDAPSFEASLVFTPDEPGDFVLVANLPVQPGEKNRVNNQKQFRLRVNNQPMRVLYIEGQLRPDFTFLKARLASDPDINLITFVRTGNPDELGSNLVSSELISAERLKELDVVLLGDFESSMLSPEAWKTLSQWVNEGGGLMVLGGYHNLGLSGLRNTALKDMLPVSLTDTQASQQLDEPFSFTPDEQSIHHPVLKLSDQPQQDIQTWSQLAALPGIVTTGPAKPAAEVLVRHPRGPSGKQGKGFVVLATQNTGKGRTAILTADTTWRWSRIARLAGQPDTQYARFWSQMIRYLASRPADSTPPQPLSLSTDSPTYEPGQRVMLQVIRNPAAIIPGQDSQTNASSAQPHTVTLTISRDQELVTELTAKPTSSALSWTADFYPEHPGQYKVTASLNKTGADNRSQTIASTSVDWLVQGETQELDDAAPNPELLKQIAQLTHGSYADLTDEKQIKELIEKIPATANILEETSRRTLWNNPLLFLIFVGCVSSEWLIRRRNRLM